MLAQSQESRPAQRPRLRGRAAAAQLDDRILEALAGGSIGSAGLASHLGISRRTTQYRLNRLIAHGLVAEPGRGTYELTPAAQSKVLAARLPPPSSPLARQCALAKLPAEHQAMLRLITDAVVARCKLGAIYASNWPGFVLLGPSKTGKTLIAKLACSLFGLDPALNVRVLTRETEGSLWGRRAQTAGASWQFAPSPLLRTAVVGLDEYDKARPEVQRAAHAYLQGDSVFEAEGDRAEVRATPIVTLNQDVGINQLPDAYLRRSVVLDTTALSRSTADIDETARTLLRSGLVPLSEDLAPPEPEFPEHARTQLRDALKACLTELGWRRVDVESISRLCLGRWSLDPEGGPLAAALHVAADYLLCTATRAGEVQSDWAVRLDGILRAMTVSSVPTALGIAKERLMGIEETRESERARRVAEEAAVAGKREELLALTDRAVKSASRPSAEAELRIVAAARGKAKYWRAQIKFAASLSELAQLERAVRREVLMPLAQSQEARVAATEAARRSNLEAAERRTRERQRQQAIEAYVAQLQKHYRRVSTSPGDDVLGELIRLKCVEAREESYQVETFSSIAGRGWRTVQRGASRLIGTSRPAAPSDPFGLGALLPKLYTSAPTQTDSRQFETRYRTYYVSRGNLTYEARQLMEWGAPGVRAVLRAAAAAYARALREPTRRAVRRSK